MLFTATLILIAWRVGVYTYEAQSRGMETMILQWPLSPFLWVITALFVFCVPVQFLAFIRSIVTTLEIVRQDSKDNRFDTQTNTGPTVSTTAAKMFAGFLVVAAILYFGVGALDPVLTKHGTGMAILVFFVLWGLVLMFVPLAAALAICAILGAAAIFGYSHAFSVLGSETVGLITDTNLAVIPFFLMMGGFATAAGMSADIFRLAQALFGFLRGGLAIATIGGCAGFGALTGTSIATVATIGPVALPEMKKRGYSIELITGSIAAGATLGQLVPPSTAVVIYALLVQESIGRLYIAVLVPAFITALLYMLAVSFTIRLRPSAAPVKDKFQAREIWLALKASVWVLLMFVSVIGGIYTGIFTATEAAAVGAVIAFLVAVCRGKLSKETIWQVVGETTRSTSMLYFLIIGALTISFFMGTSGLPESVTSILTGSGLPGLAVLCILAVIYILLGTVMDSFAIMITTAPLVAPIITGYGYDLIWWGVIMVILVEMGVVTPPFGLNLFMVKSIAPEVSLTSVYRGVLPFVITDTVKLFLLIIFPSLSLWLAHTAMK
jgi:C4-dicarboxylate transporter DctM subunit